MTEPASDNKCVTLLQFSAEREREREVRCLVQGDWAENRTFQTVCFVAKLSNYQNFQTRNYNYDRSLLYLLLSPGWIVLLINLSLHAIKYQLLLAWDNRIIKHCDFINK